MEHNSTSLSIALDQHETSANGNGYYSSYRVTHNDLNGKDNHLLDLNNKENLSNFFLDFPEKLGYDVAQRLFLQISNRDESVRSAGLEYLSNLIVSLVRNDQNFDVEGFAWSPPSMRRNSVGKEASNRTNEKSKTTTIVQQVVASVLRLSERCPFADIRSACKDFLTHLKNEDVRIPTFLKEISRFIPDEEIHPVDTDDEQTYLLYTESFVHNCRLEHMVMVMGSHPQYLQLFLNTNFHLLQSNGMLSYPCRSYIAIMAAARHKCAYLVHIMEAHFLLQGGEKDWLKGLDHAPAKLQALSTLNKLLAHRPWLVTPKHIKELMKSKNGAAWQQAELAQAIVLLCHFHSVAIFCLGTGLNLEIDHQLAGDLHFPDSAKSSPTAGKTRGMSSGTQSPVSPGEAKTPVSDNLEELMEKMKKLDEEEEEEITREEMNRRFEQEKQEASHSLLPTDNSSAISDSYFSRYVVDSEFAYQDFAKRDSSDIPTFREQDYNWDDHAFLMVSNYDSEIAEVLDDKFKVARNLTYKTLASKEDVDTTPLRRAIWKYVHCMYGIMYDDYNYGEVNQLLARPLKMFIKTVACFPHKTKKQSYDSFWKLFRHSEKVHVCIMLLESRFQIGLLYGMRAITQSLQMDS